MLIEINPESRVTFMNNVTNEKWTQWKKYKDCTDEEKDKVNLGMPTNNYIIFDKDLPGKTRKEIDNEWFEFRQLLKKMSIDNFIADRSPSGFHVFAKFYKLDEFEDDVQKEIRKIYIKKLECDESKVSINGVISLPEKPHFKNGETYKPYETLFGTNKLKLIYVEQSINQTKKNNQIMTELNVDKDFKNYFETDPFFTYIKNNKVYDGTNRDLTIFPNLAIAAIKSGKTLEEIKEIIEPLIKENFKGKNYAEFYGWLKKARSGEIKDYNPFQLNTWMRLFSEDKKDIYDTTMDVVEEIQEKTNKDFKVYWDKNLGDIMNVKTEWIVDKWIPKGDISFIAGKAASFKSTLIMHMAYAISEGKMVFNKYPTIKSKVLYLNEENASNIILSMISRVKKGLDLDGLKSENICFSILENIRLDNIESINQIINFVNTNNIKFLICDSFRRFIGFDENNATEMNKLFNNLKFIRNKCNNLTIVLLHHLKKDNASYTQDMRDMLRGSSDIVNSADSIIGIKRKHGFNAFQIEHIKNRSAEEMKNKLILMETGDKQDMSYFYESDKEMDHEKILSKDEECAEAITKHLKENGMATFTRSDLKEIIENYSTDIITKAFRILRTDETIISSGGGKYSKYTFNKF